MLYDRRDDPHELRNLITSPEHRKEREELHALTKQWMAKSRDEHVPFDLLKQKIYVDPAAARAPWSPLGVNSAARKARPVDLLTNTSDPGS